MVIGLLTVLAGCLAALSYGIGAIVLAMRGRRTWPNLILSLATALTALWAIAVVANGAGWFVPIQFEPILRIARQAGWFAVIIAFLRQDSSQTRLWRWFGLIAVLGLSIELGFAVSQASLETGFGITLTWPLVAFFNSVFGLVLIENLLRNLPVQRAWSLKLLAIGLAALFSYNLLLRLPELLEGTSLDLFVAAEPLAYVVILPLFIVAAIRNDSLRLQIHSSRNIAFHSATILFAGILLQGTAAAAFYIRNFGGTPLVVVAIVFGFTTIVGFVVALSSHSVRSRIRAFINENFYSYKYDYRLEWKKFIETLSLDETRTGPERVLRTLTNLLDSPGGVLWVQREGWRQFVPLAHWSLAETFGPIDSDDPLLEPFRNTELQFLELSDPQHRDVAAWRKRFPNAWLAVPIRHRDRLLAFALLQKPRAARKLDWEDRNLLALTVLELGAHLVHEHMAQVLADSQQMQEFNKRVTFAVHDLKNTAGQLKLLIHNAERFGNDPAFQVDMLSTLRHATEKLNKLIDKLRATSEADRSPSPTTDTLTNISDLVAKVAARPNKAPVHVQQDTPEPVTIAIRDPVALENALEHIVTNAVEASSEQDTVQLNIARFDDCIKIRVTDKGPGMSEEFIARDLFRPFHSTKKSGMGVGAFQARTILKELGGDLLVSSKPGLGTTVTLVLPSNSHHHHHIQQQQEKV
jgi:putative PEP-CTERM system histidine kinase